MPFEARSIVASMRDGGTLSEFWLTFAVITLTIQFRGASLVGSHRQSGLDDFKNPVKIAGGI
jgi:hypothetical protein